MKPLFSDRYRLVLGSMAAYWCLLFALTHLPAHYVSDGLWVSDFLAHMAGYAVLAGLWGVALRLRGRLTWGTTIMVMVVLIGYGGIDEWTQRLVPGRTSELSDWVGDAIGVGLGLTAAHVVSWTVPAVRRLLFQQVPGHHDETARSAG